jgi:hypothetical protein
VVHGAQVGPNTSSHKKGKIDVNDVVLVMARVDWNCRVYAQCNNLTVNVLKARGTYAVRI